MVYKKSGLEKKEKTFALIFGCIPLLGFLIFTLVPAVSSIVYSFYDYNVIAQTQRFVAFENFSRLFAEGLFLRSVGTTLILMISLPIGMILGLLLALAIQKNTGQNKLFRILYYLPGISSVVAVNIVWRYIFNYETGLFNALFGLKIDWLTNKTYIKVAIIIKNVWSGVGGSMIFFLAGLTNIGKDYYEAADLDGAGTVKKFFCITLPMLSPIVFYVLIVGLIGGLQSYADSAVFAGGSHYAWTVVYYIWQVGLKPPAAYGLASAASIFLFAAILVITLIQFKLSNKWVYEGN